MFSGKAWSPSLLTIFIGASVIKVIQVWLQEFLAVRASTKAKSELRQSVVETISENPGNSSAELGILAGRGLDALDPYFAKYIPQLVYAMVVTPLLLLLFFVTDFASGVSLAVTIPLVPIFMVLIGWRTSELQKRQLEAITKLGTHFSEVVKALPTLKLFGRSKQQLQVIDQVSESIRVRTMRVLRLSFLSGFALELTASLSVALVAVSVGLRLVSGELPFSVALFLLILAPEVFLPIRSVGANFHASSEGVAASESILNFLEKSEEVATTAAKEAIVFRPGLTVIRGKSGVGKSQLFAELLGFAPDRRSFAWLDSDPKARRNMVAWMPQQPMLTNSSVEENIVGYSKPDLTCLSEVLDFAEISELAKANCRELSGGEAARVNLARALFRMKQGDLRILLLDEPTSSLDSELTGRIQKRIAKLAEQGRSVVVISHEESYLDFADEVIEIA